jgi:hypothetical protein
MEKLLLVIGPLEFKLQPLSYHPFVHKKWTLKNISEKKKPKQVGTLKMLNCWNLPIKPLNYGTQVGDEVCVPMWSFGCVHYQKVVKHLKYNGQDVATLQWVIFKKNSKATNSIHDIVSWLSLFATIAFLN